MVTAIYGGVYWDGTPAFVEKEASEQVLNEQLATTKPNEDSKEFPEEIGQLVFLRHLKISCVNYHVELESIPASICKLPYLETIHVEGSIAECLPNEIWMMRQLRHLQVNGVDGGIKLPRPPSKGDHTLSKLQVLSGVEVDVETAILFRKSLFPNLRKLYILKHPHYADCDDDKSIQASTEMLASLESLQCLEILKFGRFYFGQLSDSFPSSSKLTRITFDSCNFLDLNRLMESLGKLANLRILKIKSCGMLSSHLYFRAGDFPQVEVLKMIDIYPLGWWELETHALPNLQHLVIDGCGYLRNLPDELWSLANLRMVEVLGNTPEYLKKKLNMTKQSKRRTDTIANSS
ncbi:hypothetical protein FEM48_Zijuj07G0052900 [Ziziphus jujuba var. spinosa]|uniref:Disease resistance R13L4/SHOC-2-like LRR domain-containing protein n=1 Tax=Ziziphus jujuba var. spinosa TaxID=714518 RepID=A0A978V2P2_ZIZJJ|nr:hypothetical protein FEM48_Zijuj07G0052900 [Ziziphus jujuba var. spinosa]